MEDSKKRMEDSKKRRREEGTEESKEVLIPATMLSFRQSGKEDKDLAGMLEKLSRDVTHLIIFGNKLTDAGVDIIIDFFSATQTKVAGLRHLDLRQNLFTDKGKEKLANFCEAFRKESGRNNFQLLLCGKAGIKETKHNDNHEEPSDEQPKQQGGKGTFASQEQTQLIKKAEPQQGENSPTPINQEKIGR